MTPERWQQIEHLYHAALERPPAERAAFLDAACAGDEALRREIESLLAFDEQAENFIETFRAVRFQSGPEPTAAQTAGFALLRCEPITMTLRTANSVPLRVRND